MARHQYGIFAEGTRAHHHLELTVREGTSDAELASALVAARAVNVDHRTTGGVNLVIGFGPATWDRLRGGRPTAPLRDFPGYRSADGAFAAPATQRDLWVWAHGATVDVVLAGRNEAARALVLWLVFLAQPVVTDQRAHTCLRFSPTHPQQYMPCRRHIPARRGHTQPVDGNITIGKPGPHFGPLFLQPLLGVCRRAPFVLGVGL